jgi:hypothetical protein
MVTDRPPRGAKARREFEASDAMTTLAPMPEAEEIQRRARELEQAMAAGEQRAVRLAGEAILEMLARTYGTEVPALRVLGQRPRSVWEGGHSELFGDYDFALRRIRVWMRTAVLGKVTSFRGLLHTLLHEFGHHLDRQRLGFPDTPHTRGFHARVDELYHLALGTPPALRRPLAWIRMGSVYRLDWSKLRGSGQARRPGGE